MITPALIHSLNLIIAHSRSSGRRRGRGVCGVRGGRVVAVATLVSNSFRQHSEPVDKETGPCLQCR